MRNGPNGAKHFREQKKGTYTETPKNKSSERRRTQGKCGVLKTKGRRKELLVSNTTERSSKMRAKKKSPLFCCCDGRQTIVG